MIASLLLHPRHLFASSGPSATIFSRVHLTNDEMDAISSLLGLYRHKESGTSAYDMNLANLIQEEGTRIIRIRAKRSDKRRRISS
jgi:hypothetical protein